MNGTLSRRCFLLFVLWGPLLGACSLFSTWHWERPGAGAADYSRDEIECKGRAYSGTDGMVTRESVRRMHACLEGKGWRKVPN